MSLRIVVLVIIYSLSNAEIHRARGPGKSFLQRKLSTPRSTWPPGPVAPGYNNGAQPPTPVHDEDSYDTDGEYIESYDKEELENKQNFEIHSRETWIYSLISASLVGLSGIFPLLVIPIEAGEALKQGAPAARLRLLLSFAVGSLLGDVFLHLLPEAWAHLQGYRSHQSLGVWVILGLCSFLIIEKIFPDDEDEDENKYEDQYDETKSEQNQMDTTDESNLQTRIETLHSNGTKHFLNRHMSSHCINGISNDVISNGTIKNRHHTATNGTINRNGVSSQCNKTANLPASNVEKHHNKASVCEKSHIKTSGWLNLLANVIDNFTHGLAVAGSYCISTKVGLLTTFAVLLHEIPHEVGDFAILLKSGFDRWKAAKAQIITASGGIAGALCALLADSATDAGDRTAWVLPFTSGGFIYIALVTVVPDLMRETNHRESLKQVLLLCCGIATMALVTVLFE